MPKVEEI
jgi:hypothetical protein